MASELPVVFDDDNPEWTDADFAQAKPASDLPPHILAAFPKTQKRKPGRPVGTTTSERQQVSLRLPRSIIEHFKAEGPGWQTRVVAGLERLVLLDQAWFDENVLYRRPDGSTEAIKLRRAVEKFIDLPPSQRDRADVEIDSTVTLRGGMKINGAIGAAMLAELADVIEPGWRH